VYASKQNDVKETIIRETRKLFLAKGFLGASVKEITEAAGIGRAKKRQAPPKACPLFSWYIEKRRRGGKLCSLV
jgi:hypothetical protein